MAADMADALIRIRLVGLINPFDFKENRHKQLGGYSNYLYG
jgi:hypothetical protein